jgi:quercetin dioxygenase-like cupin family protein
MHLYHWDQIVEEQLNSLIFRKVIHCHSITMAKIRLSKGAVVPMHSHVNEQITTLERGTLRFLFEGEQAGERILRAGEMLQIPPHLPHRVEALEDSLALDLFSPAREDWIRGDDAYLRQATQA